MLIVVGAGGGGREQLLRERERRESVAHAHRTCVVNVKRIKATMSMADNEPT